MRNTKANKALGKAVLVASVAWMSTSGQAQETTPMQPAPIAQPQSSTLTARPQAIVPISAFAAAGDIDNLKPALEQGLSVGLSVNEVKEILVQLYAYAGFPRSLNALGALMQVLESRQQRGDRKSVV